MTIEKAKQLINSYNANKARVEYLSALCDRMAVELEAAEAVAIEGEVMHAVNYDGMPHAQSRVSPVEQLALRHMDGYVSSDISHWRTELEDMRKEMHLLKTDVRMVDAWLMVMTDSQRKVLINHDINHETWANIEQNSDNIFGRHYVQTGLRLIRKRAYEVLESVIA